MMHGTKGAAEAANSTDTETSSPSSHSTSSSEEEDSTILTPELSGPLIKNPGGQRRLPYSLYCGMYHHLAFPGNLWINKLEFGPSLDYQCCNGGVKLPMFQCPRGFGKSSFLDLAAFQNDTSREPEYSKYFVPSHFKPEDEYRAVLCLDVGEFRPHLSPQKLRRRAMNGYIATNLKLFLAHYKDILGISEEKFSRLVDNEAGDKSILAVLSVVDVSPVTLYLFVDNFNVPLINCQPLDVDVVSRLPWDLLVWPVRIGMDQGSIAGGCFAGLPDEDIPTHAKEANNQFDAICVDLSNDDFFSGAFGLTGFEVKALAREMLGRDEDVFMDEVERSLLPYYMADFARYSFTGIFGLLKKLIGQAEPQFLGEGVKGFDDPYSTPRDDEC